jgi:hypothetical protein
MSWLGFGGADHVEMSGEEMERKRKLDVEVNSMIRGTLNGYSFRGQLRGHNDTSCGRPAPGRPIGRPGVDRL